METYVGQQIAATEQLVEQIAEIAGVSLAEADDVFAAAFRLGYALTPVE